MKVAKVEDETVEQREICVPTVDVPMIRYEPQMDIAAIATSLNIDEAALVRELKQALTGCEADVKILQTMQMIERPMERIVTYRKKITILKDK